MTSGKREFTLSGPCPAVAVPAGSPYELPRGTKVFVTQALGGTLTIRADGHLYQIDGAHAALLGPEAVALARAGLAETPGPGAGTFSEEALWDALRTCFDPEIPVNIVDLGLIYDLRVDQPAPDAPRHVAVKMTLTAPGCGMGPSIAGNARQKLLGTPGVASAEVAIVWDPQWTPHMISPAGRKQLGL